MKNTRAFTLIELLVAVAVIGMLAALLLPVLAQAKQKSYRTKCVSNLRQIGLALQSYADDHNNRLPGPVWLGFYDTYDNEEVTRLSYYLAPYLGSPAPSPAPQKVQLARCPAAVLKWAQTDPGNNPMSESMPLSYVACPAVTNINSGVVTRPFGYPNSHTSSPTNNIDELPKKVNEIYNPSSSWSLKDVDEENAELGAAYYYYLPMAAVHGTVRNYLFFDWHVAAMPK